jgi:hypothetical protein
MPCGKHSSSKAARHSRNATSEITVSPSDYYDLWRILETCRDRLDVADFPVFLREKCAIRDVTFSGPESFFPDAMLTDVEKTWTQWLGPLVQELPSRKTVIEGLRSQITALLGTSR